MADQLFNKIKGKYGDFLDVKTFARGIEEGSKPTFLIRDTPMNVETAPDLSKSDLPFVKRNLSLEPARQRSAITSSLKDRSHKELPILPQNRSISSSIKKYQLLNDPVTSKSQILMLYKDYRNKLK